MKNIVIAGGGTAGWITALYVSRIMPDKNITLIESSDIGILGAGEGSNPTLIEFLNFVGIPLHDLFQHCEATVKNGIKFTNWNNDNEFYYHGFHPRQDVAFSGIQVDPMALSTFSSVFSAIHFDEKIGEIDFTHKISEKNLVPFIKSDNKLKYEHMNLGSYSIHFNAVKLAKRFSKIAMFRKVKRIEANIVNFKFDKNNNINSIVLDNGNIVECDFIFDCTGFARLIIGKMFKSEWKSYSDYLPVDSALPFFLPIDENIPPYTESIAMKYGWMWKIPLQNRYGCGYVYDSSLISEQEAAKEIEEFLGFEPEYPRKNKGSFKFKAGYVESPWINNCLAVGLSAGFIEPLEATSIGGTILFLKKFLSDPTMIYSNNQDVRDEFNNSFKDFNEKVLMFLYFHYMSKRKDTEFWKHFTFENAPLMLKNILNKWKKRTPTYYDGHESSWLLMSWVSIGDGIGMLDREMFKEIINKSYVQKQLFAEYQKLKDHQENELKKCLHHNELIRILNEI